jgi:hypothetical protein
MPKSAPHQPHWQDCQPQKWKSVKNRTGVAHEEAQRMSRVGFSRTMACLYRTLNCAPHQPHWLSCRPRMQRALEAKRVRLGRWRRRRAAAPQPPAPEGMLSHGRPPHLTPGFPAAPSPAAVPPTAAAAPYWTGQENVRRRSISGANLCNSDRLLEQIGKGCKS